MSTRRDSRGMEKFLRSFPLLVLAIALAVAGCSSDLPMSNPAQDSADERGVIRGELNLGDVDFEYISATNGDPENPIEGPFAIRGRNVRYEGGALLVDLTVANLGNNTYNEPVSLTFASIAPDSVTVLDPDGEESGPGAMISFQFENDDAMWTPSEESLSRATGFVVAEGTAVAFVAILNAGNGEDGKGSIGGMVWDDANGDGIMDTDEAAVEGAMLTLNAEGLDEMVTASAADGSYVFTGLDTGFYTVDKIAEEGVQVTTGRPIYVTLIEFEGVVSSFLAANFGCMSEGSGTALIKGVVFEDTDGDGVRDEGEPGIGAAGIDITGPNGLNGTGTTVGGSGAYTFLASGAGEYTVTSSPITGMTATTPTEMTFTLAEGESKADVNFGYQAEGGGIATIKGVVFDDTDGDGVRDEGEPGIGAAGIDITGPNGLNGTGTTVGGSGAYTFLASGAGEYTVTSSPITGMTATTPTEVTFTLAEGESKADVNFGYQAEGGGIATIKGVVFDDTDGDGVRDEGEPGIGAAGIDITGPNGLNGTGTTVGGSGAYTFLASGAGEYTVTSSPITGMTATTPTEVTFTLAEGESKADVNFGYQAEGGGIATIKGVVFDDTDGDGVRDEGEPGIGAAGIDITGPNGLNGTGTTVGGSGAYTFLASGAGEYTVTSSPITGMTATTPTEVTFTLAEGESKADVNFGYQAEGGGIATIKGVVFDDTDGDGVRDEGEPGIGAAGIDITGPNGLNGTGTTVGGSGAYTFLASGAGEYTVTSSPITGMTATTPTEVTFTLAEGESKADVNFGYQAEGGGIATIKGVVFDDTDGDGVRDEGEPGIGAAGIDITGPNGLNGTGTTVGGSGAYTFLASGAGEYTVTSSPITGMTATTPTEVTFTLAEGESKADVNFGYQAEGGGIATIKGVVFDDTDGDGVRDEGEPGIGAAGIDITGPNGLNGTGTTVGGSGAYTFLASGAGEYTVTSSPITGMTATTPTEVTFTLAEGESKADVNFGYQSEGGEATALYGIVFEDHNRNGEIDEGDDGIRWVQVRLCSKQTGNSMHDKHCRFCRYRLTDRDGSYSFDDLDPGRYKLEAKRPRGFYAVTDRKLEIEILDGQRTNVDFAFARKCNRDHDHGDDDDDDDDDEDNDSVALPGGGNRSTTAGN